jgi:hypothetical protein
VLTLSEEKLSEKALQIIVVRAVVEAQRLDMLEIRSELG